VSQGVIRTVYTHKSERSKSAASLEKEITALLRTIPGVEVSGLRPDGQKPVSISLVSKNTEALYKYAAEVERTMQSMPEFVGVESSLPKSRTEWQIIPDYEIMAKYGVTSNMLAAELRQATQGESDSGAVKYKLPERELRIIPTFGKTLGVDEVMALPVPTTEGLLPISTFGTIVASETPSSIARLNQSKQVSLQSNLAPGVALGTAMEKLKATEVWKKMPAELKEVPMGDAELTGEMFASFQKAMGLGLFFVFATLLLLFNSVWRPFVILWSLPLSIGGAVIGLYIANQSMGISALIGILMLLGIVGKNAILLVDYAMEKEAEGKSMEIALTEAGEQRVQPIIMTTIAMVAGMIPVVLGLGDGSEFRIPMGVAVIGGLITATLLSLVFVPALYKASHLVVDYTKAKTKTLIGKK
jgi:multidrug efflux pump subunit AcrB